MQVHRRSHSTDVSGISVLQATTTTCSIVAMSDEAEPISMTVYPKADGTWWVRVWSDVGEVMHEAPTGWNGEGGFYNDGLDFVVAHIPDGYAYSGSASWDELDDGSFSTVLHQLLPGFS